MTKNNRKLIRIFFNMQTIWVLVCSHSPRMAHYKPKKNPDFSIYVPQYVLMSRHNAGGKDFLGGTVEMVLFSRAEQLSCFTVFITAEQKLLWTRAVFSQ